MDFFCRRENRYFCSRRRFCWPLPGFASWRVWTKGSRSSWEFCPSSTFSFTRHFTQWEGGFCVGPRYLVPAIAVLCLGLGPVLENAGPWIRRLAIGLSIAGFSVQAINLATSFFEDQANGNYYDVHYNYRMDYSPLITMSRQLIHYIMSPVPAPPGRGFDRWFVFLSKAGVSRCTDCGDSVRGTFQLCLFCKLADENSCAPSQRPQLSRNHVPEKIRGNKFS